MQTSSPRACRQPFVLKPRDPFSRVTGYWLFHCHFLFHIVIGMNLVLHVGTHADLPPVPENFPRCGDFLAPVSLH